MTSKDKVKRVYPEAIARPYNCKTYWRIFDESWPCASLPILGTMLLGQAAHRESWAWADAWRNIQAQRKEEA